MERVPVESKALRSVGYDAQGRRLEIEFSTGRIYIYEGVPPETHAWLLRVKNKGGFVTRVLAVQDAAHEVTPEQEPADLSEALRASLEVTRTPHRE